MHLFQSRPLFVLKQAFQRAGEPAAGTSIGGKDPRDTLAENTTDRLLSLPQRLYYKKLRSLHMIDLARFSIAITGAERTEDHIRYRGRI